MSATNTTPNYNLSQFIGTDKPAWLQDYNGDMLKIDTGINGAKTAADNAASAAGNAQTDATSALTQLGTLSSTVSSLVSTVGTAVGNINTINSLIGNGTPTTTDQTIIGAINELNANKLEENDFAGKDFLLEEVNITVTADGTKTYSQLLSELKTLGETTISALSTDEKLELRSLTISTVGAFTPTFSAMYSSGSSFTPEFTRMTITTTVSLYNIGVYNTPVYTYSQLTTAPAVTVDDRASQTPASGVTISIGFHKYGNF